MKPKIYLLQLPLLLLLCSACSDGDPLSLNGPGGGFPPGQNPAGTTTTPVDPVTPDTSITDNFVLEDTDDDIANTTFARTISIVFGSAGATVTGDETGIVSVSGNDVTVDNTDTGEIIRYELSGTASDGFFKIYGNKKQALVLKDLDLTNPNGAAINNQNKKRTFVVLQGSNKLADGKKYTATPEEEDEKAAFFSEAQLIFSGSGSLTVTATGKAGITSDDYLRILDDPTISISSTGGHGLRGKDAVMVGGGKLDISVSKKGKKAISKLSVKKGKTVKIKSSIVKANKKFKIKPHRKVKYESSNVSIVTVTTKGVIRGKKKGTAYVYAYAQNGVAKRIKVTVQ